MLTHQNIVQLVEHIGIETKGHSVADLLFVDNWEAVGARGLLQSVDDLLVFKKRTIADDIATDAWCLKIPNHEHAPHNNLLECSLVDHRHNI